MRRPVKHIVTIMQRFVVGFIGKDKMNYMTIEYKDGRVYSQIVYNVTHEKLDAIRAQAGVKEVKVRGNSK